MRHLAYWLLGFLLLTSAPAPHSTMQVVGAGEAEFAHYAINVTFDPVTRTMSGSLLVDWTNHTGDSRSELFFRLYPNAGYYTGGSTTVSDVVIDGSVANHHLHKDQTVLQVDAPSPLEPGERVRIELDFVTRIPAPSGASFGILGGAVEAGWWLADWHPILAGWEPGSGWYLAPPTRFGDPTFAESATWELRLVAPSDLSVVGSGVSVDSHPDAGRGLTTTLIEAGPGRDLTLTLLPGELEVTRQRVGDVEIVASFPAASAMPGLGRPIVDLIAEVLPLCERWLGAYHDRELDITVAMLAGAPAVSWHGVVWLDPAAIGSEGQLSRTDETWLRFVLLHELIHQWIPGIVGSNNNDHGFMSEGLATTLAVLAARELFGVDEAHGYLESWVASGYLGLLERGIDGVANAAITDETDFGVRNQLVYGKAAIGFEALRQAIGDEAFFAGLATYAAEFRFGISGPADLRATWEHASGQDLTGLWNQWFDDAVTTVEDVREVLDGFVSPRPEWRDRPGPDSGYFLTGVSREYGYLTQIV